MVDTHRVGRMGPQTSLTHCYAVVPGPLLTARPRQWAHAVRPYNGGPHPSPLPKRERGQRQNGNGCRAGKPDLRARR